MKIEILNIKPQVGNVFSLLTRVGKRTYTFQIMIEKFSLGTDELINVSNNRDLWETLRYNVKAISKIHHLVLAYYNGEEVFLPATISEEQTPKVTRKRKHSPVPILASPLPAT